MNRNFINIFEILIKDIEHFSKKVKILLSILIYLLIFFLLLLYRYYNQSLDLDYLYLFNLSNLISIIHFGLIIALLILLYAKHKELTDDYCTRIFFFSLFILFLVPISQLFYEPISFFLSFLIIFLLLLFPIYLLNKIFSKKDNFFVKSILITIILSLFVILIVSIYILSYISDNYEVQNGIKKYDIAVIFGAAVWKKNQPSPVLRERILKALSLYRNNKINYFLVTGSNAKGEISESEAAKHFLISKDVPDSVILLENKTTSTIEQIKYIRDSLYNYKYKDLVLVSDNFHLRRITEMCNFNGIKIRGVSSDSPLLEDNIIFYTIRESLGLILFWYFGL
ncbi:MAG TPA: YdcF family protein [Ignavibacteria bacterium]